MKYIVPILVLFGFSLAATAEAQWNQRLTPEVKQKLLSHFDADNDGQLGPQERTKALAAWRYHSARHGHQWHHYLNQGHHWPTREQLLKRFDADGDGQLGTEEKKAAHQTWYEHHGLTKKELLSRFDANGDGRLGPDESKKAGAAWRDRVEDIFDRREDRWDEREDIRDAQHDGGRKDQLEDIRDAREDVRDEREDVRDANHRGLSRDRFEDVLDRREDMRDRRKDVRDRQTGPRATQTPRAPGQQKNATKTPGAKSRNAVRMTPRTKATPGAMRRTPSKATRGASSRGIRAASSRGKGAGSSRGKGGGGGGRSKR